ncbi:lysosomal alpha-mannosidase isoform X2 [Drosophila grimshawi]|uniref:Alpha-mannosidase n=1 Tax=Drosophila grimshawi TaxID=7222 RepID=B4JQ04_DROGR|nr:lysosomal alpha-mannosidase isoform X2 [Drosophila grimshawi]EDV98984.1 GH13617 [Drosophila grimshawi]
MFGKIGAWLALLYIFSYSVHNVELRNIGTVNRENKGPQCGYPSCHPTPPGMLNVHLIAHTHDDVGWLKTVDQYYYGSETLIQKAGVQYIIDSVVQSLLRDPAKRFIYVESAFFFKWWKEQTAELQEKVKMLVNEGRLEFIGGAWSMNDEATTHYQSTIDQFAWGLRLLNDTFGECGRPRVGWQIDPFGHSREMASMFAQMGFDGMFFGRLDYQDKDERLMMQKAEMIWHGSANLGDKSDLFTGALYNNYQAPAGFCFDILCADQPIIDGKHSPDNNVKERVNTFLEYVKTQSRYYRTNNIIITMGGDFTYQAAQVYYKNLDKLIRYANERQANGSNINLLYSTPSCYLKSLHDAGISWPTKSDDFFPYASDPHAYWTGYFTSRPTLKRFERDGNHFLQVCKQLTSLAPKRSAEFDPHLNFMRETMGIMQHHDAVTGTEKQKVALDYAKRLSVALRACSTNMRSTLNQLSSGKNRSTAVPAALEFKTCTLLNISSCALSETNTRFALTLYNPLAHETDEYIRIPVADYKYAVLDPTGKSLPTQVVPVPNAVAKIKYRRSIAQYELIFLAAKLPAVGYRTYYIEKPDIAPDDLKPGPAPKKTSSLTRIGNGNIKLTFDTNGFLSEVTADGMTRQLSQEFLYYEGAIGNNAEFLNRSSGAYIFRPKADKVFFASDRVAIEVYKGPLVQEVHQKFNDWVSQVVRIYKQSNHAEFEWLVGPIPIEDHMGKEVITRFKSDIESDGIFYTDSNGREMLKRQRNHRETWNVKLQERVSGNYYPVTTKIALEDTTARMAILTDRAQGGSSLQDGELELMVHRRLLHDDAFGVGEALNETEFGEGLIARGKHHLFFGQSDRRPGVSLKAMERLLQLQTLLPAWKFFSNMTAYSSDQWLTSFTNTFNGVSVILPKTVHLLTLEPWHENELLVRFEHILEKDEDSRYSKYVQFNIKDVLAAFNIESIRETTLDGNAWLDEHRRMEFVPDPEEESYDAYGTFAKTSGAVHLLEAAKPLLEAKYSKEALKAGELGAESNRLKRNADSGHFILHKRRSQQVRADNVNENVVPKSNDREQFLIELSPMEIRTFVVYLSK